MKNRFMINIIFVVLSILILYHVPEASDRGTKVTFSGSNFFEGLYGKKPRNHGFYEEFDFLKDGEYRIEPWYYIKDIFDMNIGVNKFYFRGRFLVDLPSMGYHPEDVYWYREILSQRTFGYSGDILKIEVGHFKTEFGRGITISLKEDPLVELSNLLDGVQLMSEFDFGTFKIFAGRNLGEENQNLDFLEDYEIRDNIFGGHVELFPFSYIPFLSSLSASSISSGVLNFRNGVSDLDTIINQDTIIDGNDTLFKNDTVYTQPRTNIILPSWGINLSVGEVNFYFEHARGFTKQYGYIDSLDKEDIINSNKSYASFLEISGAIGDLYLRGEYKNYFYGRYIEGDNQGNSTLTGYILASYTDAPWARFKHLWHLLAKRTLIPHIEDEVGYNIEVTWSPSDEMQLLLTGNFGGPHKYNSDSSGFSQFTFDAKEEGRYYDIYAEFYKKFGEIIDLKMGVDYGHIDPKYINVLYRTIAGRMNIGPFKEKHTFGLQTEIQLNTVKTYAEDNYKEVKKRVMENIPEQVPDSLKKSKDYKKFEKYYRRLVSLDEEVRTEQENLALNWLAEINYNFSSIFKISFLCELETIIGKDDPEKFLYVADDIQKKSRIFPSAQISVTPVPNHTFIFEAGSFSRKKICNMGTCTIIPAFKGIKFTIRSVL